MFKEKNRLGYLNSVRVLANYSLNGIVNNYSSLCSDRERTK